MSRKRTCAISSSISFLTSAGIPIDLDTFASEENLNNDLGRRDQMIGIVLSNLLIVIQSIYSLWIHWSP
jgi:hypothetical protein